MRWPIGGRHAGDRAPASRSRIVRGRWSLFDACGDQRRSRQLPHWLVGSSTRSPTSASRAGSSGRSASLFLHRARARCRALPRMSQLVLAALAVRLGFLFAGDRRCRACSSPIVKRLIGRARPFVGGELDPFLFCAVQLDRPICQPAVRPCHHGLRGRGRDRRALAARARRCCGSMRW